MCSTKLPQTPILLGGPGGVCCPNHFFDTNLKAYLIVSVELHLPCMHMMISSTEPSWSRPRKSILGIRNGWHVNTLGIVHAVPDRSATTLLPIIQQYEAPGTIVWSDEWASYCKRMTNCPLYTLSMLWYVPWYKPVIQLGLRLVVYIP